ncbi:MAG TPA: four helix bundle protein [Thermomicrobiales bacterium]|nr:four helix bundle protein [Thermomicrobiales bacterium]
MTNQDDTIRDFTDLRVWQKGMELTTAIYAATRRFPQDERFGLTSQLRRCAVSVPSNIAEGHSRNQHGEFLRFLLIARGSLGEMKTQLWIANSEGMIDDVAMQRLIREADSLMRQISALHSALENRGKKPPKPMND